MGLKQEQVPTLSLWYGMMMRLGMILLCHLATCEGVTPAGKAAPLPLSHTQSRLLCQLVSTFVPTSPESWGLQHTLFYRYS